MAVAAKYTELFKNMNWGQAGSFVGFMTLAVSLFLVAYELKQARDIAQIELMLGRLEMHNKINGIYDYEQRLKRDEAMGKLLTQGEESLDANDLAVVWAVSEGIFGLGAFGYEAAKKGLNCSQEMNDELSGYSNLLCQEKTRAIFMSVLGETEFGSQLKKTLTETDCTQPLADPYFVN